MTWRCTVVRGNDGPPTIIRLDEDGRWVDRWNRDSKTWQAIEETNR